MPYKDKSMQKLHNKTYRRRRELKYSPLNKPSDGTHGHHVDKKNVIYMPKELHKTIKHKQSDISSMNKINLIAWDYMEVSVL